MKRLIQIAFLGVLLPSLSSTSAPAQEVGTVVAWGYNAYGQTNIPENIIAVAVGSEHTVALKGDGTVVAWGGSGFGGTNVPEGLSGVIAITADVFHTVALKTDGTVVAWGGNGYGETNVPEGLSGVTAIAAGFRHTVALKGDGTVVAWGYNGNGQTNVPEGLSGVTAIAAGYGHTVALKDDGTVVAWGYNTHGQTDVPAGLSGVTAIAAGHSHTVALKGDGTVVAWGYNAYGQTNVPEDLNGVSTIAVGSLHTVALKGDGTVVAWGYNGKGQTNVPENLNGVTAIAAGWEHTVALKDDGTLAAWGSQEITPMPVGLSRIAAIAAGKSHTVVLKGDGTVAAWGFNGDGQTDVPAGLSGVIAVAAGENHTVALKGDGTVVAWGNNGNGQTNVPEGLSGVIAIATGYYHTVALKGDGTVVAWGYNGNGQTNVPEGLSGVTAIAGGGAHTVALKADGTVEAWGAPGIDTPPTNLSGVIAIVAGFWHSVALKSDGTVVGWGWGDDVPAGLSGVIAIAAGEFHTVALKGDGTVVAWGDNGNGQTDVPAGLSGVTAIAAGGAHTVVLVSDSGFPYRPLLTLTREVPASVAITPDKAGTLALKTNPTKNATKLTKGSAPQTSNVAPGTQVTVTATSKTRHLFSHWIGLPTGAQESGSTLTFIMPVTDTNLTAVFVANPFLAAGEDNPFAGFGSKPVFQSLLLPASPATADNATAGLLTATLVAAKGSLSGKVFLDGKTISYRAVLHGDGSVWFRVGKTLSATLPLSQDKTLSLSWSETGLQAMVTGPDDAVSEGLAQPKLPAVPVALLNRSKGRQGYFTLTLPTREPASPEDAAAYPQGTGYATITLARAGTLRLAGVLADGTKITASSMLVAGDASPIFIPLTTPGAKASMKGGSLLGTLEFDATVSDSDVTGTDWQWFRPAVVKTAKVATHLYTAGWPEGIFLDPVGALYDSARPTQDALSLGAANPASGNARLVFEDGKLVPAVEVTHFNITGNKAGKILANDKRFTLSLAKTGLIRGTFTPNWSGPAKKLPAFQGVLLQKGGNKGGFGFFLSNAAGDLDPESGRVTLGAP